MFVPAKPVCADSSKQLSIVYLYKNAACGSVFAE